MRIRCFWAVLAVFLASLAVQRPAQALARHTLDDQELSNLRSASPSAADAYVQAEVRLRTGDWLAAEKLLATAREASPASSLLARRHCQVLTQLGKREAAIAACKLALSGMTAMDERAYVGALMSGNALTTPKDLADAVREAANARRLVGQPFSDAAFCEIANRIGDQAMFAACVAALEKNAPGYFETERWRAARGAQPWLYVVAWWLLAAFAAATLAHAFWRWFRAPAPRAQKGGTTALVASAPEIASAPKI